MSPREIFALRDYLSPELKGRTISDPTATVSLTDALSQSCLGGRVRELSGRSVLLSVSTPLIAALAMIELDGVVKRMLLCPPDLNPDHIQALIESAEIDAVVTDEPPRWTHSGIYLIAGAHLPVERLLTKLKTERATEWLMLTSGTSGVPKIVRHTLEGLCGAIVAERPGRGAPPAVGSPTAPSAPNGNTIFMARSIIAMFCLPICSNWPNGNMPPNVSWR